MKLYVARHGQTRWNTENRICGRTDLPLTRRGMRRAEKLAADSRLDSVGAIISSPMLRARQTARPAAKRLGLQVVCDERLIEQDYGIYEGQDRKTPGFLENKANFALRYPGGESALSLCHRVYGFLDEAKTKYRGKDILLICHGGVFRMINTYFEDMTNREFAAFSPENCRIKEYVL